MKQTIAVIDDDVDVRASLQLLLEAAEFSVRSYASAVQFLESDEGLAADCIVTDVLMPDMTGLEMLEQLGQRSLAIPVILITGHGDLPLAVQAMRLGARDFLEKPFCPNDLIDGVRRTLRSDAVKKGTTPNADAAALVARLSPREREVLRGIVSGSANKCIAYDLGISVRTIEVHRANIMEKMGTHGSSNLIRVGIQAGFLQQEGQSFDPTA